MRHRDRVLQNQHYKKIVAEHLNSQSEDLDVLTEVAKMRINAAFPYRGVSLST